MAEPTSGHGPRPGRARRYAPWIVGAVMLAVVALGLALVSSGGDADETATDEDTGSDLPELTCGPAEDTSGDTSTCTARGTISPDVTVVEATDLEPITVDRMGTSVLDVADEDIEVDDIVVTLLPEGPFYGRVVARDATSVTTEYAPLPEVFPEMELDYELEDPGAVDAIEDGFASALRPASLADGPRVSLAATAQPPTRRKLPVSCSSEGTLDAELAPTLDAPRFRARASWDLIEGITAEVTYRQPFRMAVSLVAEPDVRNSCSYRQEVFGRDFAPITFFIGPVPVVVTQHFGIDVALSVETAGSLALETGVQGDPLVGVRLADGEFGTVSGGNLRPIDDAGLTSDLELITTLGLPVSYDAAMYGLFGFSPAVTPQLDLTVDPDGDPAASVGAGVEASLTAFVDAGRDLPVRLPRLETRLASFELVKRIVLWELPADATTTTAPAATSTTSPSPSSSTSTTPSPGCGSAQQCDLDTARARWAGRNGEAYRLKAVLEGEGTATYCVAGTVGDRSSIRDLLDHPACPDDAVANGPGVEEWFDTIQDWIDQGVLVSATYDSAVGLPTAVSSSLGDGTTLRLTLLL